MSKMAGVPIIPPHPLSDLQARLLQRRRRAQEGAHQSTWLVDRSGALLR